MMMALTDVVRCPLHVAVRLRHVNAEVHEAVRVAPLVVVPSQQLLSPKAALECAQTRGTAEG